jgi:hypothetical protein
MKSNENDIIVSKEVMKLFNHSVRVIDNWHTRGIVAIDPKILGRLQKVLPEMFDKSIMEKYNISISYKGNEMKNDFAKMGIEFKEERFTDKIQLGGIPISWQLLKKAGIDNQKFDVLLTPKQMQ